MNIPSIFTYHCICSHLILATTRDIFQLPRRQPPGLDGSIIVPLPPPPRSADSDNESDENEEEEEEEDEDGKDGQQDHSDAGQTMEIDQRSKQGSAANDPPDFENTEAAGSDGKDDLEPKDYTLLLSSVRDRRPCVIRREDGFEKRLLWRCGRCRLIFGYQIYDESLEDLIATGDSGTHKRGKRDRVGGNHYVYILPGGLTTATGMGSLQESDLELVRDG